MVLTDLDGSLLDHHTYAFTEALPALEALRQSNIPLVLNSSKTQSECSLLQDKLELLTPMIVENGGGIYTTVDNENAGGYWGKLSAQDQKNQWIKLGVSRDSIQRTLEKLKKERALEFRTFSEMSLEELCEQTNLPIELAINAQIRNFSEPLLWLDSEENHRCFVQSLHHLGLNISQGGRFQTVSGNHNKGGALRWIRSYFASHTSRPVRILALGDAPNDLPMLEAADKAICVRSPVHSGLTGSNGPIEITQSLGPKGWCESVHAFADKLKTPPTEEKKGLTDVVTGKSSISTHTNTST